MNFKRIAAAFFAASMLAGLAVEAAFQMNTQWRVGPLATQHRDLAARDMDGDGTVEIVSSSGGAVVASGYDAGFYVAKWIGPNVAARTFAIGDVDGDGDFEIVAGGTYATAFTASHSLTLTHYGALSPVRTASIPDEVTSIAIANVDDEMAPEVLALTAHALYVYDAATLALEWIAAGRGGTKVLVANVEGDARPEIIVNGNPGYLIDGCTRQLRWGYSGGFGAGLIAVDIDDDGRSEFISSTAVSTITAWNPDTAVIEWQATGSYQLDNLVLADTEGDAAPELFVIPYSAGGIRVLQVRTGALIRTMTGQSYYTYSGHSAAAGDLDDDGAVELVLASSSSFQNFSVVDAASGTIEFTTGGKSSFGFAAGDIDGDGDHEFVVGEGSSFSGSPALKIRDARTAELVREVVLSGFDNVRPVAAGQLDADPQLEIIALTSSFSSSQYTIYDGLSNTIDGDSGTISGTVVTVRTANVDADAVDEVIVALQNGQVMILNGATRVIQRLITLGSGEILYDIGLGDYDGDSRDDLAIRTQAYLYVFDPDTGTQKIAILAAGSQGTSVGIVPYRPGIGGYLVTAVTSGSDTRLVGYGGSPAVAQWQCPIAAADAGSFAFGKTSAGHVAVSATSTRVVLWNVSAANPCASAQAFPHWFPYAANDLLVQDIDGDASADIVAIAGTAVEMVTLSPVAAAHDVDGDSRADLTLQNSAGDVTLWLMNGATHASAPIGNAAGLEIAAVADFDGDSRSDLLLRNAATGEIRMWLMNGAARAADVLVGNPGATYDVVGTGDFDGDGKADILLNDATGSTGMWLMNGPNIAAGGYVGVVPGYSVLGVADFDGDGKSDILLGDNYGAIGMWLMNGSHIAAGAYVGDRGGADVGPIGDFNGDGRGDIVLQDWSGGVGIWLMNGSAISGGAYIGSAGPARVAATGDYDGDGDTDLLLRHETGSDTGIWFMQGAAISSGAFAGSIPAGVTVR